jgi:hypothetical protein
MGSHFPDPWRALEAEEIGIIRNNSLCIEYPAGTMWPEFMNFLRVIRENPMQKNR